MTSKTVSIRNRLLYRTGVTFLALLSLLSIGISLYARNVADYSYDRLLTSVSLSMAESVYVDGETVLIDPPYSAFSIMQLAPNDKVYYKVIDHNSKFVSGYEDLPLSESFEFSSEPQFFNANYRNEPLRLVAHSRLMTEPEVNGWVVVVLGQGVEARTELFFDLFFRSLFSILGVIVLAMLLILKVINDTLRPLRTISQSLTTHSLNNPTPLAQTSIKEVAPLVNKINDYHIRMHSDYELMKNYIADASHQIRTGLSTVQAYLDISRDGKDIDVLLERFERIRFEHLRISRLAGQILSHAMITHGRDLGSRKELNLDNEMKSLLTEFVRDNVKNNIIFGYNYQSSRILIMGDRLSIREAVRNLLDNAVRYAGDESCIDLSIFEDDKMISIVVDDSGPGVPKSKRKIVLQRFSRLSSKASGSGLGLSIAESVSRAHGGFVSLKDSPHGGLRVILKLRID